LWVCCVSVAAYLLAEFVEVEDEIVGCGVFCDVCGFAAAWWAGDEDYWCHREFYFSWSISVIGSGLSISVSSLSCSDIHLCSVYRIAQTNAAMQVMAMAAATQFMVSTEGR
jgi:hypothetical protein